MRKNLINKNRIFLLATIAACIALYFIPTGYTPASPKAIYKARVISVDNHNVMNLGVVNQGTQSVKVKILTGPFTDKTTYADNILIGDIQLDFLFSPNDKVLVEVNSQQDAIQWTEIIGPDRLNTELLLTVLFIIILIVVAGSTGANAVISFAFAILIIWKLFIPLCLKQYDPIWCGLLVVSAITFVISILVGGWTKKGAIAFMGSFLGILTTCIVAVLFSKHFYLNGAIRPFAKTLLMKVSMDIDITRIFIAGVFIACSGAVMDLAMDISAALCEVKKHHPEIAFKELFSSGLHIGRAVVGTMTTTLLLAYSGGYTTLLMYFMAQGIDVNVMLNSSFLSAEILNTLVGSFGLVTVAPFTALVASLVLTKTKNERTV